MLTHSSSTLAIPSSDLINLSVSNGQINDLAELYSEARHEIRELLVPALRSVTDIVDSPRNAAIKSLTMHSELLESYLEIERFKSRLGGYVVGFGLVRTLIAGTATAMIGLWTVLRAAGVAFTMETMCVAPS